MIRRYCPTRGCRTRTSGGHCGPHALAIAERDDARRHAKQRAHGRDTAAWRRLSAARRRLAGGRCELRLAGCRGRATTAHLDERLEGAHELATLDDVRAACLTCHGRVDAPRAARAVKAVA